MRLRITLEDGLVAELDRRVGPRRPTEFIAAAVERGLEDNRRWESLEAALGSIADRGHDWDDDSACLVHEQRRVVTGARLGEKVS
jgi:hypothetical protein